MDIFITVLPSEPSSFLEPPQPRDASKYAKFESADAPPVDGDRLSGYYGSFCVII